MSDLLRQRPPATPAMLAVWSDAATIGHALAFETALARAQEAEGVIAPGDAEAVETACASLLIDPVALAEEAAHAGTLAIPLVRRLRASAEHAHRGATSQDLADTVLMVQVRAATTLLRVDTGRIRAALRLLAERHAATSAIGRTLLQDALPIPFGLRVAQWRLGAVEATRRLFTEVDAHAVLQLGGPVGTGVGLGGPAVAARVAATLGLSEGPPWHARRTGVAGIAAAVGILIGTLGKMARDVALLAQNTVGEAHEPFVTGRGGSSAMAHKRNPVGAQVALAAAHRAPGLVAGVLGALPAELERGVGGWQAEGPMLADLFLLASGATAAMAEVAEGLDVDGAAIARNLAASGLDATPGKGSGEGDPLIAELLARGD
ncbi:MAG TPA: lyase family protein [Sphingomonas sp.]